MTPEDIIKNNDGHPDWQNIKITNPDEYQRLSQNAILCKLENVLPFYLKWQRKIGGFNRYVNSIPCITEVLNALNFKIYEQDKIGKQSLTSQFYSKCISYGVEEIIKVSSNFDSYRALKIKNLINRSFKQYYSYRCKVVDNIVKLLDWEEEKINRIELLAYIPFQNYIIGIDWMLRRLNPTMTELLHDWLILLSFDVDMFISDEFFNELKNSLGDNISSRLVKKLLIHVAKSETENSIYNKITRKYKRQISKYKKLLSQGQIIEDINFGDLNFNKNNVCFYKCCMPIYPFLSQSEITYLKQIIDSTRLLTIFVTNIPINGVYTFRPIFAKDMEYLMMSIKKVRNEAQIIPDEDVKSHTISSINKSVSTIKSGQVTNRSQSTSFRVLATNVQAIKFKIRKSVIEYKLDDKVYYFRSVKIPCRVPKSILEKIEHHFTLVKDKSVTVNNRTELRFYFQPANDLSFLLAEIERLSLDINIDTDESFPQSGEFEIPWRYVRFYEGIVMILHPNPSKRGTYSPYYFRNPDILKSFEDIRSYIEKRSPKLRVESVDGVITNLINFTELMEIISQYKEWKEDENIWIGQPIKTNKSFSKETFIKNSKVRKSPYLSHLASLQHDDFKIIYLLERVIHESGMMDQDEYGYLFVLKKSIFNMVLLYENITDSSRSSILFYIHPDYYWESIENIRKFLASGIKNKRQKLSYGQIRFNVPYIKDIKRIKHSNIIDWKYTLNEYL